MLKRVGPGVKHVEHRAEGIAVERLLPFLTERAATIAL